MSKISYGVGAKVRIHKDSSWYNILQSGTITSVAKEGNTFLYTVGGCAWIYHHDLVAVNPPATNMTPFEFCHGEDVDDLNDENAHKPIHVSSGDKEWAIISYYEAHDGHMCIDIEEIE